MAFVWNLTKETINLPRVVPRVGRARFGAGRNLGVFKILVGAGGGEDGLFPLFVQQFHVSRALYSRTPVVNLETGSKQLFEYTRFCSV